MPSIQAKEELLQQNCGFCANISHELSTPLNALVGFAEILQDQIFGALNSRQTQYVQHIVRSARHMQQLLNDIFDLSKIDPGTLELEKEAVDLVSVLNEMTEIVSELATDKQIELAVDVAPDLPRIFADRAKLNQVVYALLNNGIRFTPKGGQVTVRAVAGERKDSVCISVADTGIGLKTEDRDRIFGSFEQVDSFYTRIHTGIGLGLALSRRLVEMHGGRIWVASDGETKGSRFSFELPLGDGESPRQQPTSRMDRHRWQVVS